MHSPNYNGFAFYRCPLVAGKRISRWVQFRMKKKKNVSADFSADVSARHDVVLGGTHCLCTFKNVHCDPVNLMIPKMTIMSNSEHEFLPITRWTGILIPAFKFAFFCCCGFSFNIWFTRILCDWASSRPMDGWWLPQKIKRKNKIQSNTCP